MPNRLTTVIIFCFSSAFIKAQSIGDSAVSKKFANAMEIYLSALGDQSPLYNGKEYVDYEIIINEGHAFFESREFMKGEIQLEGMTFREVPMLYDLIRDELIVRDIRNVYKVILPASKVRQFVLAGHTFVRIEHNDSNRVKTGFYDQLYNGKLSLYARREKKIFEKREIARIDNIVQSHNSYYILKEGVYHNFKNQNGLLDILKDKKKEIQQYFKKNKIKFKDDPETAMVTAVNYYNRL